VLDGTAGRARISTQAEVRDVPGTVVCPGAVRVERAAATAGAMGRLAGRASRRHNDGMTTKGTIPDDSVKRRDVLAARMDEVLDRIAGRQRLEDGSDLATAVIRDLRDAS
jgi:hypothetical protein